MEEDNWNKKAAPSFVLAILVWLLVAQLKRKYSAYLFLSGERTSVIL